MKTFATLFSGAGLSDVGAMMAGLEPVLAIEYNPNEKIGPPGILGEMYAANLDKANLLVRDVRFVHPKIYEACAGVDVLLASPPCTRVSNANSKASESPLDIELAEAVCRAIRELGPAHVVVENVPQYAKSQSIEIIKTALRELGYRFDIQTVNAADFGVPQTRKRMILRASKGRVVPPLARTHLKENWNGWYDAISDLLPDCPDGELAPWQLKRLPHLAESLSRGNLLIDPNNPSRDYTTREPDEPSVTVTSTHLRRPITGMKAVLVEGDAAGERPPTTLPPDAPSFTVKTASGGRVHRALLMPNGEHYREITPEEPSGVVSANHGAAKYRAVEGYTVKNLTPRCLARFQTLPDWYKLPQKKSLACTGIGNGVPCLLMQRIIESFGG